MTNRYRTALHYTPIHCSCPAPSLKSTPVQNGFQECCLPWKWLETAHYKAINIYDPWYFPASAPQSNVALVTQRQSWWLHIRSNTGTFSKSCKPILNCTLGSIWVFSFPLITLSHLCEDDPQWQVRSVAAYRASPLLTLWGCLRPLGRDSVSMRTRSNTDPWVTTKQLPNRLRTVKGQLYFPSRWNLQLPEHSLFNYAVRALWFIYL